MALINFPVPPAVLPARPAVVFTPGAVQVQNTPVFPSSTATFDPNPPVNTVVVVPKAQESNTGWWIAAALGLAGLGYYYYTSKPRRRGRR